MTDSLPGLAAALERLAQDRDPEAWEVVVTRAGAAIERLARRVAGDSESARDAMQETLLQIRDHAGSFTARAGGDGDQQALRWIMRVTTNVCLQLLRRTHRQRARERRAADQPRPVAEGDQAGILAQQEELALMRRELAELPERVRYAIVARHIGGLAFADIASDLGVAEATARVHVHRGLLRLRDRLARLGVACGVTVLVATLDRLAAAEPLAVGAAALSPAAAKALLTSPHVSSVSTYSSWSLAMPIKIALVCAGVAALSSPMLLMRPKAPQAGVAAPSPTQTMSDLYAQQLIFPLPTKGLPTRGQRSPGTRIVLWPQVDGGDADYAIGIEHLTMWQSLPIANREHSFRFIAGDTEVMRIQGDGSATIGGGVPAPDARLTVKDGHLQIQQSVAPLIAADPGNASRATLANATDSAGRIELTLRGATAAGALATVTFAKPYAVAPIVTLTPANAAAAKLSCYVSTTADSFTVAAAEPGQDGSACSFNYQVIETQ